jgi:hypothetical protein
MRTIKHMGKYKNIILIFTLIVSTTRPVSCQQLALFVQRLLVTAVVVRVSRRYRSSAVLSTHTVLCIHAQTHVTNDKIRQRVPRQIQ